MDYRSGEISLPFLYASEMMIFQWMIYHACIGKKDLISFYNSLYNLPITTLINLITYTCIVITHILFMKYMIYLIKLIIYSQNIIHRIIHLYGFYQIKKNLNVCPHLKNFPPRKYPRMVIVRLKLSYKRYQENPNFCGGNCDLWSLFQLRYKVEI